MNWNKNDPRETTEEYRRILIYDRTNVFLGSVFTDDESWCVHTQHEFENYSYLSADDNWPSHWHWTDFNEPAR